MRASSPRLLASLAAIVAVIVLARSAPQATVSRSPEHPSTEDGIVLLLSQAPGNVHTTLGWTGGGAPFRIYRSLDPAAVAEPSRLQIETPGREWIEPAELPPPGGAYYYLVRGAENSGPIGNAGPDQTVATGSIVQLDGSSSHDPEGTLLSYSWFLTSVPPGSAAALTNPTAVNPSFVADLTGAYVAQLIVSDGLLDSAPDTATVTVEDGADLRIAISAPSTPAVGARVSFQVDVTNDGPSAATGVAARFQLPAGYTVVTGGLPTSGSYDPVTGDWTIAAMGAASGASLSFTVNVNPTGPYNLVATISGSNQPDPNAANNTAMATVTPNPNAYLRIEFSGAPAGTLAVGSLVSLAVVVTNDGPASTSGVSAHFQVPAGYSLVGGGHPTYDPATGNWTIGFLRGLSPFPQGTPQQASLSLQATVNATGPLGLTATIAGSNQPDPDLTNNIATATPPNRPPVANAGVHQAIGTRSTVLLDGTLSSDADGDSFSLQWTFFSRPANSAAVFSDATAATPSFIADAPGTYTVRLTVADTHGAASAPATVTISADVLSSPPVIASTAFTIGEVGQPYQYDVAAVDPDAGDILTFSLTTAPTGMAIDPATGVIDWTPAANQGGPKTVVVRVQDQGGLFATQGFSVQVSSPANHAPVASDDAYEVRLNESLSIPAAGVLANDTDSDQNGLTATLLTHPTNGTVGFNPDGSFTYTPSTLQDGELVLIENLNLATSVPGAIVTVGGEAFNYYPALAFDDDLNTDANTGFQSTAFLEIAFPHGVTVHQLQLFGPRAPSDVAIGYVVLAGSFQLFDSTGTVVFDSGVVDLPEPNHDATLSIPDVAGVRRVRFTDVLDRYDSQAHIAELKVIGSAHVQRQAVVPEQNLAQLLPVTVQASSSLGSNIPESIVDDFDFFPSWYSSGGPGEFIEILFPLAVTVTELQTVAPFLTPDGQFQSGNDFLCTGTFQLLDLSDNVLFDSGVVNNPSRDFGRSISLPVPSVPGVRRMRYTVSSCAGSRLPAGFAEVRVLGSAPLTTPAFKLARKFQALVDRAVHSTTVVANLTDDNGDGTIDQRDIPDIVVPVETVGNQLTGEIKVISGDDGRELLTLGGPDLVSPWSEVAVGDIDGDAFPDIVAVHSDGNHLIAFDHTGQIKWISDANPMPRQDNGIIGGAVAIANLTNGARAHIVVGASVFDSEGHLLGDGRSLGGTTGGTGLRTALSTVADLNLDFIPEIIAGPTAYRMVQGQSVEMAPSRPPSGATTGTHGTIAAPQHVASSLARTPASPGSAPAAPGPSRQRLARSSDSTVPSGHLSAADDRRSDLVTGDAAAESALQYLAGLHPAARIEVIEKQRETNEITGNDYTLLKVRVDGHTLIATTSEVTGAVALDPGLPQREAEALLSNLPGVYSKLRGDLIVKVRRMQGGTFDGSQVLTNDLDVIFHARSSSDLDIIAREVGTAPFERFDAPALLAQHPPVAHPDSKGVVPPAPCPPQIFTIEAVVPLQELLRIGANDAVQRITLTQFVVPLLDKSVPRVRGDILKNQGARGLGATIAIVDSGIDDLHPSLAGRFVAEKDFTAASWFCVRGANDGTICECSGGTCVGEGVCQGGKSPGERCVYDCESPGVCEGPEDDTSGHGTHVAGIAVGAGAAANDGVIFEGMAPLATLINAKAIPGRPDQILSAMEFAHCKGANVINGSFGTRGGCQGFCSEGRVDQSCGSNANCDSSPTASDGICGPPLREPCIDNVDCDRPLGAGNGTCLTESSNGKSIVSLGVDFQVYEHNRTVVLAAGEWKTGGRCSGFPLLLCRGNASCDDSNVGPCLALPTTPNDAFNVITVGASKLGGPGQASTVADFSQVGPTIDQRSKPDVLAPGDAPMAERADGVQRAAIVSTAYNWEIEEPPNRQLFTSILGGKPTSGTSMAAPHVAGLAAQLIGWALNTTVARRSTLYVKAAILNNATRLPTDPPWSHTPSQPLDARQGTGEIDALETFAAYADDLRINQKAISRTEPDWYWFEVQGATQGDPQEFAVTLVWERHNTDPTTAPSSVSNLDLLLTDKDGNDLVRSESMYDNVEHIVYQATSDKYCVKVEATSLVDPTETYALAAGRPRPGDWLSFRLHYSGHQNPCVADTRGALSPVALRTGGSGLARHIDWTKEWLGTSAAEIDNEIEKGTEEVLSRVDPMPSLTDDGVEFGGPFVPGVSKTIYVTVQTTVDDEGVGPHGRYHMSDPEKRLYLNAWADWDGDGSWDGPEEKIISLYEIDPETFGPNGEYTIGDPFSEADDTNHSGRWEPGESHGELYGRTENVFPITITPPASGFVPNLRLRFRLTYGEPDIGPTGDAQFGEVEDYVLYQLEAAKYRHEVVVSTQADFSYIDPRVSINDAGTIAFVGENAGASLLYVAEPSGAPYPISSAPDGARSFFGASINNATPAPPAPPTRPAVVASVHRDVGPVFTARLWSDPSHWTQVGQSPGDFDAALGFPDVNDSGTMVFPALTNSATTTQVSLFAGTGFHLKEIASYDRDTKLRPQISNNERVVVRDDQGRIMLWDISGLVAHETMIAGPPETPPSNPPNQAAQFDPASTGIAPGISPSGIVAFSGNRHTNKPGVFVSIPLPVPIPILDPEVRKVVLIAGEDEDQDGNGIPDFSNIDGSQRVAVTSSAPIMQSGEDPIQNFTVAFVGTRQGRTGIFAAQCHVRYVAIGTPPTRTVLTRRNDTIEVFCPGTFPVIQVGDQVGNDRVTEVSLYDPINATGVLAYRVRFATGKLAILRSRPPVYVALGDSYSSGEGVQWYLAHSDKDGGILPGERNKCHRSTHAYGFELEYPGVTLLKDRFLACSGAETVNVISGGESPGNAEDEAPQLDRITEDVDMLSISIGGNDTGFADVLKKCLLITDCRDELSDSLPAEITIAARKVGALHELIKSNPRTQDASVFVLGYPNLFSDDESCFPLDVGFSYADRQFLRDIGGQLNERLRCVAEKHGVHFVDVRDAFAGHEVCSEPQPWIYGLNLLGNLYGSFHPNPIGQKAYAGALKSFIQQKFREGAPLSAAGIPVNPAPHDMSCESLLRAPNDVSLLVGHLDIEPAVQPACATAFAYVPNQSVHVVGHGFAPGAALSIQFRTQHGAFVVDVATAVADAEGKVDTVVAIPGSAPTTGIAGLQVSGAKPDGGTLELVEIFLLSTSFASDGDGDGVPDPCDSCPTTSSPITLDSDRDGIADPCDPCPYDPDNDLDHDGLCADMDACGLDAANDQDGDGLCGVDDNCPMISNAGQEDRDSDGIGDACDDLPVPASGTGDLQWDDQGSRFAQFGPNQSVTIVFGTFTSACDSTYLTADIYIVRGTPHVGDVLHDVSGEPNTVRGSMGGGFTYETIGFTRPSGNLGCGRYTVVYDECQNGVVDANDSVFPDTFEVVLPVDLPPIDPVLGALKSSANVSAEAQQLLVSRLESLHELASSAGLLGCLGGSGTCPVETLSAVIKQSVLDHLAPDLGDAPADPIAAILDLARDAVSHYRGIHADPPNPDAQRSTLLGPIEVFDPWSSDPLVVSEVGVGNAASIEAALTRGLLDAMERYQGADVYDSCGWGVVHARQISEFSELLASQLEGSNAAVVSLCAAVDQSPVDLNGVAAAIGPVFTRISQVGFTSEELGLLSGMGLDGTEIAALADAAGLGVQNGLGSFTRAEMHAACDQAIQANVAMIPVLRALAADATSLADGLAADPATNIFPRVSAGGPYSFHRGSTGQLAASASDPDGTIASASWDLDRDGAFDDASGLTPIVTFPRAFNGLIAVRVVDNAGFESVGYATIVVEDSNRSPVFDACTPNTMATASAVGGALSFTCTAHDPDGDAITIEWRLDGITMGLGTAFALSPRSEDVGIHVLQAVVSDGRSAATRPWDVYVTDEAQEVEVPPRLVKVWQRTDRPDGYVSIANFDDDTYPEIVVVADGLIYMLNHDGTDAEVWNPPTHAPLPIPGGNLGGAAPAAGQAGPALIVDVDGDGMPEIGIATASNYILFGRDGSVRWKSGISDHSSHSTGSVAFDFDGDGEVEIVYRDEISLRIFRGSDGVLLAKIPLASNTWGEEPVVVDVDNDGHADIVVSSNRFSGFSSTTNTGVHVFSDVANKWTRTRRIWNQHSYHITNVNENATIPQLEMPNWLVPELNSFRTNAFVPGESSDQADRFTYRASDGTLDSSEATVRITIQPPNRSRRNISPPPPTAAVGVRYVYGVHATDPDAGCSRVPYRRRQPK